MIVVGLEVKREGIGQQARQPVGNVFSVLVGNTDIDFHGSTDNCLRFILLL